MTLADDIGALHARLTAAQRERSRAEGARDTAKAAAETVRAELQRDFGVSTTADAEALLEQLREELLSVMRTLNAKLDEIGVS